MRKVLIHVAAVALFATVAGSAIGHGQGAAKTVNDGVYSAAQAERGAKLYGDLCSSCHGAEMKAGPGAPSLAGPDFQFSWDKKTVGELFDYVKTNMPPGGATVKDTEYADIVADILKVNGYPAGAAELPAVKAELDPITIVSK